MALSASSQVYVPVAFSQAPLLLANAGIDVLICSGDTATLGGNPAGSGGTPAFTYFWSTPSSITASNISNPGGFPSATSSYILTVTDSRGCTAFDTIVVSVEACTGIHDVSFPFAVALFPNPNDGNFTIHFEGIGSLIPVSVTITNTIGQVVEKREITPFSGPRNEIFNLQFSRGTYMVEIVSGKTREIQKIVIR